MNTKALKQKILDLAIHGKLLPLEKVEKIRKEEPASVLLEKIRAEKQEKIAKGELKKDKNDFFIFVGDDKRHYEKFADGSVKDIEDEIPFDVPDGWSWCRLYHTCSVIMGQSPEGSSISNNQNELEFHQGKIFFTDIYLAESGIYTSEITKIASENSLLLCVRAPVGVVNITKREICIGRGLCAIKPNYVIDEKFWFYWIQCQKTDFEQKATGTTFKAISVDIIKQQLIPLPPLSEQQLIVAEIEKIFAQIDLLEQNKTDLQTAIKQAKSKILDLAIHGKLVSQDPNDEPAAVLLEKIRAEKEAKIAKGELKRDKNDSYIYKSTTDNCHYQRNADGTIVNIEDEIPFDVHEEWSWCSLKEVCTVFGRIGFRGYTRDDLVQKGKGAITLSPSNLINMKLDLTDCTYISWSKYDESPEIQLDINDVVVVKTGSSYGKTSLVDNLTEKTTLNPQLMVLKERKCNSKYLCYFLNTQYMRKCFEDLVNGTAIPTFSQEKFGLKLFPLPPLAEQQRIVAKIEKLFSQLDSLESNLV